MLGQCGGGVGGRRGSGPRLAQKNTCTPPTGGPHEHDFEQADPSVGHQCPDTQQDSKAKQEAAPRQGRSLQLSRIRASASQANTGLSPRGKKSHQLSLGEWQRSELGAGRALQSNHLSPPRTYRLQFKSFWHYLFWGLRRKRREKRKSALPTLLEGPSPRRAP